MTGGLDGFVILWDLDAGREIRRWRGPMKYVSAVAVSPDGSHAVIAADRVLRLWDLESGKQVRAYRRPHGPGDRGGVLRGRQRIISGSDDRTVRLWETDTGKPVQTLTGHDGAVRSVALSANGQVGTIRWRGCHGAAVEAGRRQGRRQCSASTDRPWSGPPSPGNGRQTVSGDRDGGTLIWDIERFLPKPGPK